MSHLCCPWVHGLQSNSSHYNLAHVCVCDHAKAHMCIHMHTWMNLYGRMVYVWMRTGIKFFLSQCQPHFHSMPSIFYKQRFRCPNHMLDKSHHIILIQGSVLIYPENGGSTFLQTFGSLLTNNSITSQKTVISTNYSNYSRCWQCHLLFLLVIRMLKPGSNFIVTTGKRRRDTNQNKECSQDNFQYITQLNFWATPLLYSKS